MRWRVADLLYFASLRAACEVDERFDVILDKSTSDAVACGPDIGVFLGVETMRSVHVHPVHVLAVHLAAVTATGGRWLTVSYSAERFPFFQDRDAEAAWPVPDGYPDPALLWRLESFTPIEGVEPEPKDDGVHRPKVMYWLYTLERTNVAGTVP